MREEKWDIPSELLDVLAAKYIATKQMIVLLFLYTMQLRTPVKGEELHNRNVSSLKCKNETEKFGNINKFRTAWFVSDNGVFFCKLKSNWSQA